MARHYASQLRTLKGEKKRREAASDALRHYEVAYELSDKLMRDLTLAQMGNLAFIAGEMETAKSYAELMIEPSEDEKQDSNGDRQLADDDFITGKNFHHGNNLLGRIALADGNVEQAKKYLLKAANAPDSPILDAFGPNMQLAKELLEAGETEVVLEYFDLCGRFWKRGADKLKTWREAIKAGKKPDFSTHRLY